MPRAAGEEVRGSYVSAVGEEINEEIEVEQPANDGHDVEENEAPNEEVAPNHQTDSHIENELKGLLA
jgi:hypothetical protein